MSAEEKRFFIVSLEALITAGEKQTTDSMLAYTMDQLTKQSLCKYTFKRLYIKELEGEA